MSRHSPAPWFWRRCTVFCGDGASVETVAEVNVRGDDCHTFDRALITAAPELLASARSALVRLDSMHHNARLHPKVRAELEAIADLLRPVVAKAMRP